jgi:hypothetical protein
LIVLTVDNLRKGTQYPGPSADKFMEALVRSKDRLFYDIPKWRDEQAAIGTELAN